MAISPPTVEQRLLAYRRPARTYLHLATAAGFGAAALAIVLALLVSAVVSSVFIDRQTLSDVRPLLVALVAVGVSRGLALALEVFMAQRASSDLKAHLRQDLLDHLEGLGPAYSRRERTGDLLNTAVPGVEDLDGYITLYHPARRLAALVPLLVALVVLVIDPLSVIVLLVTGPLLVVFLVLIGSRTREAADRRFLELGWMSSYFLDLLQGLVTLKLFGRSHEHVENIRAVSQHYGATTMHVLRTAFETAFVLELSATIATALVAVEVGLRLASGNIAFGPALAVLVITPEFFLPLRQLSLHYHAQATGKAAAERIFALLDTPVAAAKPRHGAPSYLPLSSGLTLRNVSYAYEAGTRPALRDVSLTIPRGHKVALVGATGAGKTTVASLLLRFIEPDSGSIYLDGQPLDALDLPAWRSQVAWVPQQPHLFYGTVADNIRLARPTATRSEMLDAAAAAGVDTFVERLPRGYDTVLGEQGTGLSGGEQQRLAIARAFLKNAPFLILDEPTSHLDAANEAHIQAALQRLLQGRTALVIAHRLNLALDAGQIVVLHRGRVVEAGEHERLVTANKQYSRLVAAYENEAL